MNTPNNNGINTRIAFVAIEPPSLNKGTPVRTYNLIKQAILHGARVDLIALADKNANPEKLRAEIGLDHVFFASIVNTPFIFEICEALARRISPYFLRQRRSCLGQAVVEYARKNAPDIIQFECLHSFYAAMPFVAELRRLGCKLVLDAHNVEYRAHALSYGVLPWPVKLLGGYMAPKLLRIETEAAKIADCIFACSGNDKIFFDSVAPDKTAVIANGVDCKAFSSDRLQLDQTLLFMGGLFYSLNADGLRFYFSEIHPLVKKQMPNLKIYLLGDRPSSWLKEMAAADPTIIVTGLVPDVRYYIKKARVCISPIRKGSGTSLKVLEYMGSGKSVVSTTVGARGIDYKNGRDLFIADNPKDFAAAVVKLLRDDDLATQLGNNARKTVETNYDWKIIGTKMFAAYEKMLALPN
jgi:glycosyltransferase involved in cell wall biosynthesis